MPGSFNTQLFNFITGMAQAGGIDQPEMNSPDADHILDGITRGSGNIGYDCFFFTQQKVQQGRFAGVGLSYDGNGDAIFDHIAKRKGIFQTDGVRPKFQLTGF